MAELRSSDAFRLAEGDQLTGSSCSFGMSFVSSLKRQLWCASSAGSWSATPLGKSILSDAKRGSLLAVLFHLAFWRMDLSYFGRGLFGSWPQADAGVVLWSLSVWANDWQSAEKLTRLCTIPEPAKVSETWDRTPYAMGGLHLRPLLWFGLLEHRTEKLPSSRFGRRSVLSKDGVV